MENSWGNNENSERLYFGGAPKSLQMVTAALELKDKLPRSVGSQYATGGKWKNSSRKYEEAETKQKQCPVVYVTGNGSKV